jgi:hypothetical protein
MDIEDIKVSDEEIQEETEAQAQLEESKIREAVVADLGIEDNDANKGLIDKLVERETDHRTKLSKAVGQKIKYRELAGGKKPVVPDKSKKTEQVDPAKLVEERLMQRDLEDLTHSDKVKEQIKRIATLQDISIRKAEQDPYIQHLIAEEARQKSVDDAAKGGKKRTTSGVTIDVSKPLDVTQFDLSTPEGRAEWEDAKKAKREAAKS